MGANVGRLRTSREVVLGEVDTGLEALYLLESREEECTTVVKMAPTQVTRVQERQGQLLDRRRVQRALGVKEDILGSQEFSSSDGQTPLVNQVDEQLTDVLYCVLHLHLSPLPSTDLIPMEQIEGASSIPQQPSSESGTPTTTREELRKLVREVFQVDEATLNLVEQEISAREPPQVTVHIHLHEAKDLKAKTPRETSHPFCLVRVSGSNDIYKTRVINNTVSPAWDSQFSLKVPSLHDAKLTVEVWHEPQEGGVEQLANMRDLKELGRLVREKAANIHMKEMRNLLGVVTIPLTDVKEHTIEGWYNLTKSRDEELSQVTTLRESFRTIKRRGSLRLSLRISTLSQLQLLGRHWYDELLMKLVHYHLGYLGSLRGIGRESKRSSKRSICSNHRSRKSSTNTCHRGSAGSESGDSSGSVENETLWHLNSPWPGTISAATSTILSQYGAMLNVTTPQTTIAWWRVTYRLPIVDQKFVGDLLKMLLKHIEDEEYSEEELQEVLGLLRLWGEKQEDKLRNLNNDFPATSRVVSHHQLTHCLRNLLLVESHPQVRQHNIFPNQKSANEFVSDALTNFTKSWWEASLKNRGRDCPQAKEEQQLVATVSVAAEVIAFLTDVCNFYHDVLFKEVRVSYMRLTYTLLTSELAARIRPLLIKIYDTPRNPNHIRTSPDSQGDDSDLTALEIGSPVWQLYKKLEAILKIGEKLPEEVQLQCNLRGYHTWFLGGVRRWQERTLCRSRKMITDEVEKDTFENASDGISSSASATSYIFQIVKTSWLKLAWPDDANGEAVTEKLLQDLSSLGILYTKLVMCKLDFRLRGEDISSAMFLPAEVCIGLNNIEYLRQEIASLPQLFELYRDNEVIQFTVITSTVVKMEDIISHFFDAVTRKLKPVLRRAVADSCDTGNEAPLLQEVLDKDFSVLKGQLDSTNFQHFVQKVWSSLIVIFSNNVEINSKKRDADYFKGVYKVLERIWNFFTPADGSGLDHQYAYSAEYQTLLKTLSNLKMATESLIAKYYKERYEEQIRPNMTYMAKLIVKAYFMRTGKLIVDVLMAKDIRPEMERSVQRALPALHRKSTGKLPDTYIQIKLAPLEWFPNAFSPKTKVHKKSEEPVYQETFEFHISPTDHGVKSGVLLFLLKSHQLVHSDLIICEAVLPLDELSCVDASSVNTVANKYLNMNCPTDDNNYTAIKALQFRTWDKKANGFLKEGKRRKGNTS